jgi:hypothetical protein
MRNALPLLLALATLLPVDLSAQTSRVVQGRVMDAMTLNPVKGAFVAQMDSQRGTLTDSLGIFTLELDTTLGTRLRIWQLGYRSLLADAAGASPGRILTVALAPDPVQIDGLTVLTERLEDRRRGPYGIGEILDRDDLVTVPDGSAYDLVVRRFPFARPCDPQSTEALCMGMSRGMGDMRRLKVCIDGSLVHPDYTETVLGTLDPRTLYLAEMYTRVGEIRFYTPAYMQRLLELGEDLPPLTFDCQGVPEIRYDRSIGG